MKCGSCLCLLLFTWGIPCGSTGLVLRVGESSVDTDRGASDGGLLQIPLRFNAKVYNFASKSDNRSSSGMFNRSLEETESSTQTDPDITSHENKYDEEEKLIPKQNISYESVSKITQNSVPTDAPPEPAKKVPVPVDGDDGRSVITAPTRDCEEGSKRDWRGLCRPVYK